MELRQLDLGLGVATRPAETALTRRAVQLLKEGPASPQALVEYVCQMPGAPLAVAEHMATALFAGRPEFRRTLDGRWTLAPATGTSDAGSAIAGVRARAGTDVVGMAMPTPRSDPLESVSFVVVDVETTGGSPWFGHRITEFAAVRVENGAIVDQYETLVNPERPIPIWVTRLTRISTAMVQGAPTFREVAPRVLESLRGGVFVAHNVSFDWRFVDIEVERTIGERLIGSRLCTVKLARALRLQMRSRSLDHLANYYGVEIVERHRAGGDARATAQVLVRMLEEVRGRGIDNLEALETFTRRHGRRRRKRRRGEAALPQPVDRDTTA